MKKTLFIVFAMLLSLGAHAQLLYKISGNGLKQPSYIFGTMHLADSSFVDQVPGLRQAMQETQQTYGEVANSEEGVESLNGERLPDGQTLKTVLTKEQFDRLDVLFQRLMGAPLSTPQLWESMGTMTPQAMTLNLSVIPYLKNHPELANLNILLDMYLQREAQAAGKPIGGLETTEYLNKLLTPASIDRQVKELMCMVDNFELAAEVTDASIKSYFTQDIAAIMASDEDEKEMACDTLDTMDDKEVLGARNDHWLSQMPAIMQSASTLFAVGVGHLYGEYSLLDRLRQLGYTVEPVTTAKGQIQVIDANDKQPIESAFVYDDKGCFVCMTNSKGIATGVQGKVTVSFMSYNSRTIDVDKQNGPVELQPAEYTLKTVDVVSPAYRKMSVAFRDVIRNNDTIVLYREGIIDYYTDIKSQKTTRRIRACRDYEHPKLRKFATLYPEVKTCRTLDLRHVGSVEVMGVDEQKGDTTSLIAKYKGKERGGITTIADKKRGLYHSILDLVALKDGKQSKIDKWVNTKELANVIHWTYSDKKAGMSSLVSCRDHRRYLHTLTDSIMEEANREMVVIEVSTLTKEEAKLEMKNKETLTDFTLPASLPAPGFNVEEETKGLVQRDFWDAR